VSTMVMAQYPVVITVCMYSILKVNCRVSLIRRRRRKEVSAGGLDLPQRAVHDDDGWLIRARVVKMEAALCPAFASLFVTVPAPSWRWVEWCRAHQPSRHGLFPSSSLCYNVRAALCLRNRSAVAVIERLRKVVEHSVSSQLAEQA
jgi:hypothetical protein